MSAKTSRTVSIEPSLDGALQLFDVHPFSSDSAVVIAANSSSGAEETR